MFNSENYSIQALNLLDGLIDDYNSKVNAIRRDTYYFNEIKKLRFNINNRYRKISDLAEIKNNPSENFFQIIVFNSDYMELIISELETLNLKIKVQGQFLIVNKPDLTFNQLMSIVDELEKSQNKFISKCTKAKLEPILRAKNAVENNFIDQVISRQVSLNCQKIFEIKEEEIKKITLKKIKQILGKKFFDKYINEII